MPVSLKQNIKTIALTAILAVMSVLGASAQQIDASELSLNENLSVPAVAKKAVTPIKRHFENMANRLIPHYKSVQYVRDGMGIMVTIPCSDLFAPNETEIKASGKKYLRPFLNVVKEPTMYKVLIAVYSDNTGEPEYLDDLTSERALAIDEFLCQESHTEGKSVIPYGMGSDDPVADNDTMANRAANRRVEIYILPEWQMVDNAKSNRLY